MPKLKDLTGQRFGRLVAISLSGRNKHGHILWRCLCECRNYTVVPQGHLSSGHTKSCGCLFSTEARSLARTTHGMSGTTTYLAWQRMISRCYCEKTTRYEEWGGRGIAVCERWMTSFENFLADMGKRPPGLSLDRIDGNGNYEPGNCRWSTPTEQAWNRRSTRWITLCGNHLTLKEASARVGISDRIVHKRVRKLRISHTEAFYVVLGEHLETLNAV